MGCSLHKIRDTIFFLLLFVSLIFTSSINASTEFPSTAYDTCFGIVDGQTYSTLANSPHYSFTIMGIYSFYGEALAAAPAGASNSAVTLQQFLASNVIDTYGCFATNVQTGFYPADPYNFWEYSVWVYPLVPDDPCCKLIPLDADNDGIPDNIDPYPDNSDCFSYEIIGSTGDINNPDSYLVNTYLDGERQYFQVGESASTDYINVYTDHAFGDCNSYVDRFVGESTYDDTITSAVESYVTVKQTDYDLPVLTDSVDATGNITDQDYFADTVNNLDSINKNTKSIAEILNDIKNQNNDILKQSDDIQGVTVDGEVSIDVDAVGQAVSDAHAVRAAAESIEMETKAQEVLTGLPGVPEFDSDVSISIPDENLLSDVVGGFIADNPVTSYLTASGITAVGSCSFDWNYKGSPITFSFCPYADALAVFGTVLLGMTGLISLMVIVKR